MALDEGDASREGEPALRTSRSLAVESLPAARPWRPLGVAHPPQRALPKRVTCSVMTHWGEVIQGPVMFEDQAHVGLVTLPDPAHHVTASVTPSRLGPQVSCVPASKAKSLVAAQLVLDKWAPGLGAELSFQSTIPEGVGAGSSTADCTATVYAILEMLGVPQSLATEHDILADVFAAEGPCDPLALLDSGTTVLWGSRSGRLIKRYGLALPAFYALGFVTDPGRIVSTVELADEQAQKPATNREIDAFAAVLRDFEHALAAQSARGIAQAAMASGSLNQTRCRIEHWDTLMRLSESVGSLGVSCAHSGTAAAFLFDPAAEDLDTRLAHATWELQVLRAAHIHGFRTESTPLFWTGPYTMAIEP